MNINVRNITRSALLAASVGLGLATSNVAMAQTAVCFNCPPEWADWGTQLKAIKVKTGITVPPDNKNSGQSLAQLVAEKASPAADMTYLGVTFAIRRKKKAYWRLTSQPPGAKSPMT